MLGSRPSRDLYWVIIISHLFTIVNENDNLCPWAGQPSHSSSSLRDAVCRKDCKLYGGKLIKVSLI